MSKHNACPIKKQQPEQIKRCKCEPQKVIEFRCAAAASSSAVTVITTSTACAEMLTLLLKAPRPFQNKIQPFELMKAVDYFVRIEISQIENQ